MTVKEEAHRLIDRASEQDVERMLVVWQQHLLSDSATVTEQLEGVKIPAEMEADPVLRAFLDAPIDDEPLTVADIAAIEEATADVGPDSVMTWHAYLAKRGRA